LFSFRSHVNARFPGPWIENLRFSVQLFQDQNPDKLEEVIGRMRDLTMARNAYGYSAMSLMRPSRYYFSTLPPLILQRHETTFRQCSAVT